jgi:hypothetical protein
MQERFLRRHITGTIPDMSEYQRPTVVFWIVVVLTVIVALTLIAAAAWLFDLVPMNT